MNRPRYILTFWTFVIHFTIGIHAQGIELHGNLDILLGATYQLPSHIHGGNPQNLKTDLVYTNLQPKSWRWLNSGLTDPALIGNVLSLGIWKNWAHMNNTEKPGRWGRYLARLRLGLDIGIYTTTIQHPLGIFITPDQDLHLVNNYSEIGWIMRPAFTYSLTYKPNLVFLYGNIHSHFASIIEDNIEETFLSPGQQQILYRETNLLRGLFWDGSPLLILTGGIGFTLGRRTKVVLAYSRQFGRPIPFSTFSVKYYGLIKNWK